MESKLLQVKDIITVIPDDAFVCVKHKGIKLIEDGGTKKLLEDMKDVHGMEIMTLLQERIQGHVYVDIEVM